MAKYIHVIYCDDIREEVGNKISFMGVFHDDCLVPTIPCVLERICISIFISIPKSECLSITSLTATVKIGEQLLGTFLVSANLAEELNASPRIEIFNFKSGITFTALAIQNECELLVEAKADDLVFSSQPLRFVNQAALKTSAAEAI